MRHWQWNWTAKGDFAAATMISISIILAFFVYAYHLAGWTIRVDYGGKEIFCIPELW